MIILQKVINLKSIISVFKRTIAGITILVKHYAPVARATWRGGGRNKYFKEIDFIPSTKFKLLCELKRNTIHNCDFFKVRNFC
jgi:hypothetical protein